MHQIEKDFRRMLEIDQNEDFDKTMRLLDEIIHKAIEIKLKLVKERYANTNRV